MFAKRSAVSLLLLAMAACASGHRASIECPAPHDALPTQKTMTSSSQTPLPHSPITLEDLAKLEEVVLLGDDDLKALRMSLPILEPQVEQILDVWYGFVGSKPQLLQYFTDRKSGKPLGDYLGAVRKRFGQWILDTARADYDQTWLDYQHEIGLRHHSTKKNRTDGAASVPIIHFRYLPALVYPVTATLKPFLAKGGASEVDVERMHQAWIKSVFLQVILWSEPYVRDGEF